MSERHERQMSLKPQVVKSSVALSVELSKLTAGIIKINCGIMLTEEKMRTRNKGADCTLVKRREVINE